MANAMRGHELVISALGRGKSFESQRLMQRSVPVLIAAMAKAGVRRLVFTSAIGVAVTNGVPWFPRLFAYLKLQDIYADKLIGEELIEGSDLDWTIVHPPLLTGGALTGRYRSGDGLEYRTFPKISRADLAHFLLTQIDDRQYVRKTVRVEN